MSKQAFFSGKGESESGIVRKFATGLLKIHAQDPDAPAWNGMRLICRRRDKYRIGEQRRTEEGLCCSGSKKDAETALGSLAYGPLDHAIYDCQSHLYAADNGIGKMHMSGC